MSYEIGTDLILKVGATAAAALAGARTCSVETSNEVVQTDPTYGSSKLPASTSSKSVKKKITAAGAVELTDSGLAALQSAANAGDDIIAEWKEFGVAMAGTAFVESLSETGNVDGEEAAEFSVSLVLATFGADT